MSDAEPDAGPPTVETEDVGATNAEPEAGAPTAEAGTDGGAAPADDAGQRPTFRNRAGRRMAGRRGAQPSRTRGQGGSKYLKRCPARNERVQRKRGRGREQERHGTTWSGVVRGGAQPGDGKVCMR